MTECVRALLDLDHLQVIDELVAARRHGGGETFLEELFSTLESSCPVPAYVLWVEQNEFFTLPALRKLYRALRNTGHLSMALQVLTQIAQRTEKESDQSTLHQLAEEASTLLSGVELQECEKDEGFTETLLIIEDAESLARQENDLADLPVRLAAHSHNVVLGLVGVEDIPPQWESSRVRHLSPLGASRLSARREALGASFDELLAELRPNLVLFRLSSPERPHLSEKARARGVPTVWDIWTAEPRRRRTQRPGPCAAHPSRADEMLEQDFLSGASRATLLLAREQQRAEEFVERGLDQVQTVASVEELLGHLLEASRLGTRDRRSTDRSRYSVSEADAEQWAKMLRESPVKDPYQWFNVRTVRDQDVMRNGWVYQDFDPVVITADMDWDSAATADRTWGFKLHAWEFLDPVIRQYQKDESGPQLDWCLDIAASWGRANLGETPSSMAWYDMALSWRSPRLVGLLHLAVAAGVPSGRLAPLFELVLAHVDAHLARDSFAAHNNHGFYAALGQLVLARNLSGLPQMDMLRASGEERMEIMATRQFLSDGGHSEHSPDYHLMLLGSFEQAIAQGLVRGASVVERIRKASDVLGWFVQPDGGILQFGDSPKRAMTQPRSTVQSDTSRFILTDGREGLPQEQELFVLQETGYVMVRSPQPQAAGELSVSSYLALAAGFHSRAHKHCDDLSLVWTHQGREILVDSGRFGYGPQLPKDSPLRREGFFYASPERQYVESVVAHNTAALDGKNPDRRRTPYGSGIQSAESVGEGSYLIDASAPHAGWHHHRRVRFLPSGELWIEDTITAEDQNEHAYSIYFNFDGTFSLEKSENGEIHLSDRGSLNVAVSWEGAPDQLRVARGEEHPLRGWRSKVDRQMEEVWNVERTGTFRGSATVRTLLVVEQEDLSSGIPGASTVLSDAPGYKITFHPGQRRGNLLLVTFGTMQSGLTEQGFGTKFAAKHGYDHVYVAQKPGSWYQELSLEEFEEALWPLASQYEKVATYGSSLGAYAALYYSGVIGAQALASAPINWAHPDLVSGPDSVGATAEFVHRELTETPRSSRPAVVLYDPRSESDMSYIDTYVAPAESGLIRREVPYTGHAVLVAMRVHGVLEEFLLDFLDRDEVRDISLPSEGSYIWHCYYGEELSRLGHDDEAEQHLRRSLEIEFNRAAALQLGRVLRRAGRTEEVSRLSNHAEDALGDASFLARRDVAD